MPLKLFQQLRCNVGVASWIIGRQSAQLAQCAATLERPCAVEPKPTKTQRESGSILHFNRTLVLVQLQDVLQASPQTKVVSSCEFLHH